MKLLFNDASPYARKCLVVAIEKGLSDALTVEQTVIWTTDIREQNPLNKIPCLIKDNGDSLFDSFAICDYFDRIGAGAKLIPSDGDDRDAVLKLHAIGQGLTDAALTLRAQVMRDAKMDTPLPKDWFIDRQWNAIRNSVLVLDDMCGDWDDGLCLGRISVATGLGYLDLRFPESAWRHHGPKLAEWNEKILERPSIAQTIPKG